MNDFIWGCDRAFRLFNRGMLRNLPRQERIEKLGDLDHFQLKMCSVWPDCYKACKIIDEQSDVKTGSLAKRTAFIDFQDVKNNLSVKLDAGSLTDMRTGASGALALKYVATNPLSRIAIVGTGRVARNLAIACDKLFKLEKIFCTSRQKHNREAFFYDIKDKVNASLEMFPSIDQCLEDVDALLMAVPTPSPIVDDSILDRLSYLVVIGGDSRTRQLPQKILEQYPIVVDEMTQARNSGEFLWAKDQGYEDLLVFSEDVSGKQLILHDYLQLPLPSKTGKAVIYLTGLAFHDLCVSAMIYEKIAGIKDGAMSFLK
tara:strand:- start:234 stop:1178 length:945 start_codon:yes stop_codon:yes gene_type:complete